MPQISKRKPGDRSIPATDWNNIADAINGGVGHRPPPRAGFYVPTVLVQNDTGADLQAFQCISLDDPLFALETNGSVDLIFSGKAADPDKPAAIVTEPIAHDASNKRCGRAWIYGLAYALVGPAASASDLTAAPEAANKRLAPGAGSVQLLAAPSTTVEKLLPVLLGAASGGGDSHYLFTLTSAMSSGYGTATIRSISDSEEIETGASVVDTLGLFDGLASGKRGICIKSGEAYYAIGPYVTAVRWDDPDLEQSKDGGDTWENIDTAEDCS
ncbi:hypothetical protein [Aureliella helgolandensis]|uniref:Uncharacterized protein n=1 Tax=Aureliella helgolandensis TaxID=2527968 RepID=A0A518GEC1_9BACT|nr:hypothetical protein [Aureliella helgolandensis]QDV26943.1 hypothetical protein Q31a_53230 [Aureliella helgolandensis]